MQTLLLGRGEPLLLLHGLGGSWRSWQPLLPALAAERRLVLPDLPGCGASPPLFGACSVARLADALVGLLASHDLLGVPVAGQGFGAQLALELARRRAVGAVVACAPTGHALGWEAAWARRSVLAVAAVARRLQRRLPAMTASAAARTALLSLWSAHPAAVRSEWALAELRSTAACPALEDLLDASLAGPPTAMPPQLPLRGPVLLAWGTRDRFAWPRQARRVQRAFPGARLRWLEGSGHLAAWDAAPALARLVLRHARPERTPRIGPRPGSRDARTAP
jgi:pimeloyl-ACP methyl ester carboxylesterase